MPHKLVFSFSVDKQAEVLTFCYHEHTLSVQLDHARWSAGDEEDNIQTLRSRKRLFADWVEQISLDPETDEWIASVMCKICKSVCDDWVYVVGEI